MPWWGWLLIIAGAVLLIAVVAPLKIKLMKKMMANKNKEIKDENE